MAGDWIPAQTDLARRREVLLISEATGESRHETVGRLVDFWGWASHETTDGKLRGFNVATLGAALSLPESFFSAMMDVDWLRATRTGMVITNWDRWLSNSAKARLGNTLRQQIYREKRNKSVAPPVATKARPEKRREEKSIKDPPIKPPTGADADGLRRIGGELLRLWNATPGLRPARSLGEKRSKALHARVGGDVNWWGSVPEAIKRAAESSFCRGNNDRNWIANLDWFLRPGTLTGLLEGKYDDRAERPQQQQTFVDPSQFDLRGDGR